MSKLPFYEELAKAVLDELIGMDKDFRVATDVRIMNRIWPMIVDWCSEHVREAAAYPTSEWHQRALEETRDVVQSALAHPTRSRIEGGSPGPVAVGEESQ